MSYPNIGVDSPGRVVFLSFPFETVPTNGTAPNNAVTLLRNIIDFLAPGANGAGRDLPRQHGLYHQRRGDGGGR